MKKIEFSSLDVSCKPQWPVSLLLPALLACLFCLNLPAVAYATSDDTAISPETIAPLIVPLWGTVDELITAKLSPTLSGTVSRPTAMVKVTINGLQYPATNNGNGTWTLPAGTINPGLKAGSDDVQLLLTDGTDTATDASKNEITIDPAAPTGNLEHLNTSETSPALVGTVSQPDAKIEVNINGQIYLAQNNGDGTWTLAASTINPALAVGHYDVTLILHTADDQHVASRLIRDAIEITPAPLPPADPPQQPDPIDLSNFQPLPLVPTDPPQISDPNLNNPTITPPVVVTPQPTTAPINVSQPASTDSEPLSLPKIGKQIARHVSEASPDTMATTVTGTGIALVGTPWALVAWRRRRKKNSAEASYLS